MLDIGPSGSLYKPKPKPQSIVLYYSWSTKQRHTLLGIGPSNSLCKL
jgi:hypothetical protein